MLFNIYICPLTQLAQRLRLGCHQYVDGIQLYLLMDSQPHSALNMLTKVLVVVAGWLQQSWLQQSDWRLEPCLPILSDAPLTPTTTGEESGCSFGSFLINGGQDHSLLPSSAEQATGFLFFHYQVGHSDPCGAHLQTGIM